MVPSALEWHDLLQSIHVAPPFHSCVYTTSTNLAERLVTRAVLWCILAMGAGGSDSVLFLVLQIGRKARYKVR